MRSLFTLLLSLLLTACGFHLQGPVTLSPPLHRVYVQSSDPYGQLARTLRNYLKMSQVIVTDSAQTATTVLNILSEDTSQELLSVSGTQQTRQYSLKLSVNFEITDTAGRVLVPSQNLSETRSLTIQANQILAGSNEASRFYEDMRRAIAYAIMNRLASQEVSAMLTQSLATNKRAST